jgi:hypothetical protein
MRRHDSKFAIVITHASTPGRLLDLPWLEAGYRIDESDWLLFSHDGWRAAADGDPALWDALDRKLLIGFYVRQPELIAVVGHPHDATGTAVPDGDDAGREDVLRIARRVRSLLLPAAVLGFWTDAFGSLAAVLDHESDPDAVELLGERATEAEPVA